MKALIFALLLAFHPSQSASTPKTFIVLSTTGTDRVGTTFVYSLKEEISTSSRYSLDWNPNMKGNKWLMVYVVTMDSDNPPGGNSSVMSVVAESVKGESPFCSELSTHLVLHVGSQKAKDIAREVIATLDKDFSK